MNILNFEKWFPSGLVEEEGFCNRDEERSELKQSIAHIRHTLIVAPRRYGKSSLVHWVVNENQFIYGNADLFVATDERHVQSRIFSGIQEIINRIQGSATSKLEVFYESLRKRTSALKVSLVGVGIEIALQDDTDPAANILNALTALELLLNKKNKKAVLFIDEIQIIGQMKTGRAIEGAIRHVAQKAKNLCFIFAGSRHHLVHDMFNNEDRPLYHLCEQLHLERIDEMAYTNHLNQLAMKRWKKRLSDKLLAVIFSLTERHPYYMNLLCYRIWRHNTIPSIEQIEDTWRSMVINSRAVILGSLNALNQTQIRVLIYIASGNNQALTGKKAIADLKLGGSHISQALSGLIDGEFIEKHCDNSYIILNPMIKTILALYYKE
ncbi:MAG: ATP-binding protein [Legionellales bacterium]|nr:ATP-binding protein [Legionellales bacterium]